MVALGSKRGHVGLSTSWIFLQLLTVSGIHMKFSERRRLKCAQSPAETWSGRNFYTRNSYLPSFPWAMNVTEE